MEHRVNLGWTDDRVATLKKLWAEGLSCSQIAKQLGGVSRNAVIGKVHRLGLSGRETPSAPAAARTPRPPRVPAPPKASNTTRAAADNAKARAEYVEPVEGMAPLPEAEHHRHACQWPIGSPGQEGFGICGRQQMVRSDGRRRPYCEAHDFKAHAGTASTSRGLSSMAGWIDKTEGRRAPAPRRYDDEPRALDL